VVDYLLEEGLADASAKALDDEGMPFAICTGKPTAEMSAPVSQRADSQQALHANATFH
jgi:hypothetical protein